MKFHLLSFEEIKEEINKLVYFSYLNGGMNYLGD